MVVRFEVDACFPSPTAKRVTQASVNVEDLVDTLAGISLSPARSVPMRPSASNTAFTLKIIDGGSYVPQSSIIELTTRSDKRQEEFDWKESYPQLLLSQTPHHFLAIHQRGRFHTVHKRKLGSSELELVDSAAQESLKMLRHLLQVIKEIVVQSGEIGRLSLVCQAGELKVFERISQESCLPDDVMEHFKV